MLLETMLLESNEKMIAVKKIVKAAKGNTHSDEANKIWNIKRR